MSPATLRERLTSAWLRARTLFRRAELERDLDDELRFHLARRAEQYGAEGLGADEAGLAARRRFGNTAVLKEECRDAWTFARLETFAQDVRFALRVLWKSRGFTAVALSSLALGIGANTAMFSLVSAVLLRPLPYAEAHRLVRLTGFYPKGAVAALQTESRTMDVAGAAEGEFNLTGRGEAVRLAGSTVSANLFSVLGRPAAIGRAFEAGEDQPGRDRVVVLSHALWEGRFGADPAVVGRTLVLDGIDRVVVGVMPPGFQFPSGWAQLWVPLRMDPGNAEDYWGFGWMPVAARLRPGASVAQAAAELSALRPRVAARFPWPAADWNREATALPLQDDLVRGVRRKLLVLQAAVGIVLLIACANVASLLLARSAARRKEVALRAALGASRGRILRQLLTESVALSLLGGAAGVALALGALSGVQALLPADARGFSVVHIDAGILAVVTGVSVACGLLFGLAPAASASRVDLAASMKAGGRQPVETGGVRLRSGFIAGEVALAVVLAVGAGLMIRTLWGLMQADPGFRPAETLTVRVSPGAATCGARASCIALYDDLLRRVREMSGVSAVAAASTQPLTGDQPLLPVEMEGHPLTPGSGPVTLLWAGAVTPEYFGLMGIPVLRGRGFDGMEGERTAPVVLVSAATAARYWPGEDPVGKRIRVLWDRDWRTVTGVVGDVRQYALSGRAPADISGALYMPYPQAVAMNRQIPAAMALFVRSATDAPETARRLRALVAGVNPDVPVSEVRRLDDLVASSVSEPRAMTWLFAAFAGGALLLAAIGTYGVVSYSTGQRTYEIGVRVAVGATRRDILGLVIGQSLRLVLIGLGLGVAAALVLGRTLSSFLYGVSAKDPATFAAVAGLLLLTALLAGYLPGHRAAGTDPLRALRGD